MPKGPHKLTPEVRLKLETAAANDCTIEEMVLFADINKQTLYNWFEIDPELRPRLDKLRATPLLKARTTMVGDLTTPDGARWYLERKAKKEFGKTADVTGEDGQIIVQVSVYAKEKPKEEAKDEKQAS